MMRFLNLLAAGTGLTLFGLACGDHVQQQAGAGGTCCDTCHCSSSLSGGGATTGTAGGGAGGNGAGGNGAGGNGAGGDGAGGTGECRSSAECAVDEYCSFTEDYACGDGFPGFCRKRLDPDCSLAPTCGCDGTIYDSECSANEAGVDRSDAGGCEVPTGKFACGSHFCDAEAQYCFHDIDPINYMCGSIPPDCVGTNDCDCLGIDEPDCDTESCEVTPDGGLMYTCDSDGGG